MGKSLLGIYVAAATLMLVACGDPVERSPTDEELRRFTNGLDADAKVDSEAALSKARRGEADRAKEAEARRDKSATERREQEAE